MGSFNRFDSRASLGVRGRSVPLSQVRCAMNVWRRAVMRREMWGLYIDSPQKGTGNERTHEDAVAYAAGRLEARSYVSLGDVYKRQRPNDAPG